MFLDLEERKLHRKSAISRIYEFRDYSHTLEILRFRDASARSPSRSRVARKGRIVLHLDQYTQNLEIPKSIFVVVNIHLGIS